MLKHETWTNSLTPIGLSRGIWYYVCLHALRALSSRWGFPLTAYLLLGTMGMGTWPDSRVVQTSASADFPQTCKMEIDDESYLETRFGIIISADRHGFPLRIFFKKHKKLGIFWKGDFSSEKFAGIGPKGEHWAKSTKLGQHNFQHIIVFQWTWI